MTSIHESFCQIEETVSERQVTVRTVSSSADPPADDNTSRIDDSGVHARGLSERIDGVEALMASLAHQFPVGMIHALESNTGEAAERSSVLPLPVSTSGWRDENESGKTDEAPWMHP